VHTGQRPDLFDATVDVLVGFLVELDDDIERSG